MKSYLAVDIGASSGRHILGRVEDGKILDEMSLPPFDVKTAKEREEKVNAWLTALSW